MALGSLIAGVTGDKYGRRITYMYNLGLYTVGALLGAFAPNVGVLLVARFIVGIGLGGELNTGLKVTGRPPAGRSRTHTGRRACGLAAAPHPEHDAAVAVVSTACSSSPSRSDTASRTSPSSPRITVPALPLSIAWGLLDSCPRHQES